MNTPPVEDAESARLLQWFEQGGARPSKLEIRSLGQGERGVFAIEDLAPGELVLRIPQRYLMTEPAARASDIGRLIGAHPELDSSALYMAAFVLQERERGEASFWKPYLDLLPKSYPTHIYYYGEPELALLRGSMLPELLPLHRQVIDGMYALACKHLPGFERFSLEQFLWAHFSVSTRVFGGPLEGKKIHCLAPLADMLNAGLPANIEWRWSPDEQSFEMKAQRAIPKGQELLNTYGNNSNLHQLRHYGFVHEHNPFNEVMVPLALPREDPFLDEKLRLLGITDPSARQVFSLPLLPDAKRLNELVSELRIVHAQAEELALLRSAPEPLERAKALLSPSNEVRVFAAIAATCKAQLASYETSLEEDARLLKEGKLTPNERNCILLRHGEKQILQVYAQAV